MGGILRICFIKLTVYLLLLAPGWSCGNTSENCAHRVSERCKIELNIKTRTYSADCDNKSLTCVPICDFNNTLCSLLTKLSLKNNQIYNLPMNGFQSFPHLLFLDLSKNPIDHIKNESFKGLQDLQTLYLRHLKITGLEKEAFRPLESLNNIDFSHSGSVTLKTLFPSVCSLNPHLDSIKMDYMGENFFPQCSNGKFTSCFRKLHLTKFSAQHNDIKTISKSDIMHFRSLEYINLRNNWLAEHQSLCLIFPVMRNLTYLDIGCQNSNLPCVDIFPWADWLPGQPTMFTPANHTCKHDCLLLKSGKSKIDFYTLPKLHTIISDHTPIINYMKPYCWKNNTVLNVDFSFSAHIELPDIVPCLVHLKYVNLRGISNFRFVPTAFHEMPSLEVLMIGSTKLNPHGRNSVFFTQNASVIFKQNPNLIFLDLSDLHFDHIPNIFDSLGKLEVLILSKNNLRYTNNALAKLTSLHHLDLSHNLLTDIPTRLVQQLEKNKNHSRKKYLRLSGNPLVCSCGNVFDIDMILSSELVVIDGNLTCSLFDHPVNLKKAFDILEQTCKSSVGILFLVCFYPFGLSVILVLALCLRYRWKIEYAYYTAMQLLRRKEPVPDRHIIFDAFVAYSNQDEEWVRTKLLKMLESTKEPYALCTHDRNFLPGEYIADNIINAINASKKTILVVTKSFVNSDWCQFESQAAQAHHLNKNRIIAIVFPGVHKYCKRNAALANLLDMVTYLEWTRNEEEQMIFWIRLRRALGKPASVKPCAEQLSCMLAVTV